MATAKKAPVKNVSKPVANKAAPVKNAVNKNDLDAALAAQGPFITKPAPKTLIKKEEPAPKQTVDKGESKTEIARAIYKKMAGKPRKEVIAAFIDQAKLTKAGAATYFQKFKSE